jgi:hypothetical protein
MIHSWRCAVLILSIISFAAIPRAWSQETDAQKSLPDPRYSYDFAIFGGSILPSRMGLTETVPGWGMRLSYPGEKGVFEGGVFSGIGHGIIYRSATLDYRMDIPIESLQAHFLLGVHADQYDSTSPVIAASRLSGGWHYGGGVSQYLGGPMYMRFDFRHRFSPGQILEVTLGLVYRWPSGGAGQ